MQDSITKLRMLVVDDEITIADTMAAICRLHGFDAIAVYSGEAAVKEALAHPPAVLLTDINMGGMNGIEAAIRREGNWLEALEDSGQPRRNSSSSNRHNRVES